MSISIPPLRDPWGSLSWQTWFQQVYRALQPGSGPTGGRPTKGLAPGVVWFDTSLGKPVWFNGSIWVDSTGAPS